MRRLATFENCRYRADLFSSSRFRRAYDELKGHLALTKAAAVSLAVPSLVAHESEEFVDRGLQLLFDRHQPISIEAVMSALTEVRGAPSPAQGVLIAPVDVSVYPMPQSPELASCLSSVAEYCLDELRLCCRWIIHYTNSELTEDDRSWHPEERH